MTTVKESESLISELQQCLKIKEAEIKTLTQMLDSKSEVEKQLSMNRAQTEDFIAQQLPMLTKNQIKLMTKHNKRVDWTADELAKVFTSVYHGHRSHIFWTKTMQIPLPAIRTLNRYASKLTIAPGILRDVLVMLKGFVDTLDEGERQVLLSFDEMACKALWKYHKGLDIVIGPHKEMQVMMVRGLTRRFKQPIYVDFDKTMTKSSLFEAISELSTVGLNVVGIICDCGGGNMGLWTSLGINCTRSNVKHFFLHPVTGDRVHIFADAPHMLKLLRNWFLDGGFLLAKGTLLKKGKAYELLHRVNSEISPNFKLSELHFACKGVERMNVRLAAELFSHKTATSLRRYFPNDQEAENLANFIELVNKWFDVMNSYTPTGPWYKRAYGLNLEDQNKVLDEMFSTIQTMKCYNEKGKLKDGLQIFQKGILHSIQSLKGLFADMKANFGFCFILTHRLNQDCLENFFSQVRGKLRFKEHPTAVECLYNIKAIILGKNPGISEQLHANTIDQQPDEYVTSEFCRKATQLFDAISEVNEPEIIEESVEDDSEDEVSMYEECGSMSSEDGIEYIAGWIQKKLNYCNPATSRAPMLSKETKKQLQTSFVEEVSLGGLTKPCDLILNMVQNMENEFFKIHGKKITKQANIRKNLVAAIRQKYPEIRIDIVNLFSRSRIYFRCNFLNKKAHDEEVLARIERAKAKAEAAKQLVQSLSGLNPSNTPNNLVESENTSKPKNRKRTAAVPTVKKTKKQRTDEGYLSNILTTKENLVESENTSKPKNRKRTAAVPTVKKTKKQRTDEGDLSNILTTKENLVESENTSKPKNRKRTAAVPTVKKTKKQRTDEGYLSNILTTKENLVESENTSKPKNRKRTAAVPTVKKTKKQRTDEGDLSNILTTKENLVESENTSKPKNRKRTAAVPTVKKTKKQRTDEGDLSNILTTKENLVESENTSKPKNRMRTAAVPIVEKTKKQRTDANEFYQEQFDCVYSDVVRKRERKLKKFST